MLENGILELKKSRTIENRIDQLKKTFVNRILSKTLYDDINKPRE